MTTNTTPIPLMTWTKNILSPPFTSPELRDVVEILQEGLVLDFVVGEDEGDTLASSPPPPLLTSPELRTLLRYSRKASSLISLSVKMKVIPLPSPPTYLSWAEDVVEILQEGLILDFVVSEDEGDTLLPPTYLSWAEDGCWDIPGRPRPWFRCLWRWRW